MAHIERNRTLRPSTREVALTYKVDTKKVTEDDVLVINIDHEDDKGNILFQYQIDGKKVHTLKSIHFRAIPLVKGWMIEWSGAEPERIS